MKKYLVVLFLIMYTAQLFAEHRAAIRITVSQDGKGDYKTIQGALNSLGPDVKTAILFVRKGTYKEKIYNLIYCSFGANMKDMDIYLVPTTNTIQWGRRVYYADCHKEDGNDFPWHSNNLPAKISKSSITVEWVFGNRWSPQKIVE